MRCILKVGLRVTEGLGEGDQEEDTIRGDAWDFGFSGWMSRWWLHSTQHTD